MRRSAFFLALLLALLPAFPPGQALRAGEGEGDDAALSEEERNARITEIRQHIDKLTEIHARAIIQEQETPGDQADAALIIGAMYEMGSQGEPDRPLAAFYYRQAGERGAPEADCALGNMYSVGAEGPSGRIERDPEKARFHYERAAAAGFAPAMFRLGEMYSSGNGVEADQQKALTFFIDAAKRGDEEALERLAPVMKQARDWEAARPGRKANFPTKKENLIDSALIKKAQARTERLNRKSSSLYVELNRRIGASAGKKKE